MAINKRTQLPVMEQPDADKAQSEQRDFSDGVDPLQVERRLALAEWGGSEVMTATESVMWRLENYPFGRSSGTSLLFMDRAPDPEQYGLFLAWLVACVPRLRQKVHPSRLPGRPLIWVDDPEFDLSNHHRRVVLSAEDDDAFFDFLQTFGGQALDVSRPPWEIALVEGLNDGSAVLAFKLHHSLTDGGGLIHLFDAMLSRQPDERLGKPPHWSSDRKNWLSRAGTQLRADIGRVTSGISALRRVSISELTDYLRSALSVAGEKIGPGSPLLQHRSQSYRYDLISVALKDLKRAAKAANASINDVYLAAVLDGIWEYHTRFGCESKQIPLAFPVSVRTPADQPGANRFAAIVYNAPLESPDLSDRIDSLRRRVRDARNEPALDIVNQLMPLISSLPDKTLAALMHGLTGRLDMQISNIPGIREDVYLGGARVTSHYVLPPRPGCALMMAMITHGDVAGIAVNSDPAAIVDPERLMRCVEAGFNRLFAQFPDTHSDR